MPSGGSKKQKKEQHTLKTVLAKMVPYASFPYAEHVLRNAGIEPNAKVDPDCEATQIDQLIAAALSLRELVRSMEELDEIKGFIVYKQVSEK